MTTPLSVKKKPGGSVVDVLNEYLSVRDWKEGWEYKSSAFMVPCSTKNIMDMSSTESEDVK